MRAEVVLVDVEFVVRHTGARVSETDEIHVWRFNEDGLGSRFKHGVDTHRHQLAITHDRSQQSPANKSMYLSGEVGRNRS